MWLLRSWPGGGLSPHAGRKSHLWVGWGLALESQTMRTKVFGFGNDKWVRGCQEEVGPRRPVGAESVQPGPRCPLLPP